MKKLIIDGNDVYEVDLDCLIRNKNSKKCQIRNYEMLIKEYKENKENREKGAE